MTGRKRIADDRAEDDAGPGQGASSLPRMVGSLTAGIGGAVVMGLFGGWNFAALVGWDVAAAALMATTWRAIWPMDSGRTARFAVREEAGRAVTDLLVIGASVASLLGVGFVVAEGGGTHGAKGAFLVGLAVLTVVLSWGVVHTTFTLRYARLFYGGSPGGIEFPSDDDVPPKYSDFAYVAFTLGMTFQVSDTNLTSKPMRATALRHALLSYVFGVVIIAVMINMVAGLTK